MSVAMQYNNPECNDPGKSKGDNQITDDRSIKHPASNRLPLRSYIPVFNGNDPGYLQDILYWDLISRNGFDLHSHCFQYGPLVVFFAVAFHRSKPDYCIGVWIIR